ncbi:MAG TPA: TonB-dependent receptor [Thermoanaerobaculia bacterium]|jgi:iron complex outermembrane receptor protein
MKSLFLSLLFLASSSLHAATIRGVVTDSSGQPLAGANITAGAQAATSGADGSFVISTDAATLHVSRSGFVAREVNVADAASIALDAGFAETMVVSAIRADEAVPVTKSDLPRAEIEARYHGQDVPLLLRDAPSIQAYSESGAGGSGYSYITLRGVSPTRINFTLDGVPLADSEDMGTFFADFPDLARSLESIQIQRGVGTSTVGTPSFGGSVNLESISAAQDQEVRATFGGGSFGNEQASVGVHSGALPGGFSFYTRASFLESDGFREHSGMRQRNLFFSGSKPLGEALFKLTGFSGHERQQLSFYATDAETLRTNLRANPLTPEEKDSFGYDLANLQYIRPLGSDSDLTASAYYQRGYGWYRLFDYAADTMRQYGLDGRLVGTMLTYSRSLGALTINSGIHANRFVRDHTRDDLGAGTRDYANYGVKDEANAFAKVTWSANRWTLYGDAQLRATRFDYHGRVDIAPISWTFFNPKIGGRFTLTPRSSVYATAGLSTREPTRNDLFEGEDDASFAHDLRAVKPERLYDAEGGWEWRGARGSLAANVYAMEFRNEIASTGELSEIGLLLRRNVDRSYRRGVELEASWQATSTLRLRTSANLSRNRIAAWTQFFDVYDDAGVWSGSRAVVYRNVDPLLTPRVLLNQAVEYSPSPRLTFGATARYAGRSYLDNTNDDEFVAPSYLLLDAKVSYAVTPWARLTLQVDNVLNHERVYPSGYSYRYYSGALRTGTAYYYPQATRNAIVLLDLGF